MMRAARAMRLAVESNHLVAVSTSLLAPFVHIQGAIYVGY